jgi:deazaflavin-dependent oxidoreductase (nitroreductase family)
LTTTGRRSGESRTSAMIFGRDGTDYLVIASYGGAPRHPAWYHNLRANPRARIQVRSEHHDVDASIAGDGEKPRLWGIMTDLWPNYDVYQARTDRVIPIVILRPQTTATIQQS